MYIYQDGKLYIRQGKKLVGVEIYPHSIKKVKGSETTEKIDRKILTFDETMAKFHISEETPYIFPQEKEEKPKEEPKEELVEKVVKKNATANSKKSTRKSTSK